MGCGDSGSAGQGGVPSAQEIDYKQQAERGWAAFDEVNEERVALTQELEEIGAQYAVTRAGLRRLETKVVDLQREVDYYKGYANSLEDQIVGHVEKLEECRQANLQKVLAVLDQRKREASEEKEEDHGDNPAT